LLIGHKWPFNTIFLLMRRTACRPLEEGKQD
jgi:hypothetical protein